jgi:hypothetical protein
MAVGQNGVPSFFFSTQGQSHILLAVPGRNERVIAVHETEQQLRSFEKKDLFIMIRIGRAQKFCKVSRSILSGDEGIFLLSLVAYIVAALHTEKGRPKFFLDADAKLDNEPQLE